MDVQIISQPMGQKRDAIMPELLQQWQSEPACNMVKTGYGLNRRAYILETCSFANSAGHNICGITPQLVEYRFFENALVQVAFEFNETLPQENYLRCLHAQLQQSALTPSPNELSDEQEHFILRYQIEDYQIELQVDDALRTTVSEIDSVTKIHAFGKG